MMLNKRNKQDNDDGSSAFSLQQVPVANGTANTCTSGKCEIKLELAFEYLMSKDRLQWVTITSPQVGMPSQPAYFKAMFV